VILLQIFWVFFRINLLAFGGVFGVLPELERMIVAEHGWISHDRFIQSYVLASFVPGPNMAMCPLIGYWVAGWPGWVAGFLGIYSGPLLVIGLAYVLYRRYRNLQGVRRLETALRPLVLGLFVSSTLQYGWSQSTGFASTAVEVSSPALWRGLLHALGLALVGVGVFLYARKKLGPVSTVFAMGGAWWALNTVLLSLARSA